MSQPARATTADVRNYWNQHIHDLEITSHPVGSPGFFSPISISITSKSCIICCGSSTSTATAGKRVLEVGCGAGTDLVRFAKGGAIVTGVDLSSSAIALARQNFAQQGLEADLREADGEHLPFADNTFDLVYAHGVVQYTADDQALVDECRRVLKPGQLADLPGLQPRLVAERAVEADEGAARARGRAGARQVQRRRSSARC